LFYTVRSNIPTNFDEDGEVAMILKMADVTILDLILLLHHSRCTKRILHGGHNTQTRTLKLVTPNFLKIGQAVNK